MTPADFLPPWIGGRKLVSLIDMKEYLAHRLINVCECLSQCYLVCVSAGGEQITDKDQKEIISFMKEMEKELQFLGLDMTRQSAERLRNTVTELTGHTLLARMGDLHQRLEDETRPLMFFYVSSERLKFYQQTELFGQQFKERFPTANTEVIEAGNCFALGRFTACVYHLCRAMEIGLRVLFVSLGMPPRVWSTTKWNQILERIKGKIDKNNRALTHDLTWQSERGFYENTHAFLAAVRVPIRNATMHVESVYDETGAENVFGVAKTFMRHLATRLSEIQKARPGSGVDSLPRIKKTTNDAGGAA